MRYLTPDEARRFYDRFGAKQDTQGFYEDKATSALIQHADFRQAQAVLEFGCGTGRLAERLLTDYLPKHATYQGLDISTTMVELASRRIHAYADRARVSQAPKELHLPFTEGMFDRILSTYVLDLLPDDAIRQFLHEAHRVLRDGGLIALASLSHGETLLGKAVSAGWTAIHHINPRWVGGCRPLALTGFINSDQWQPVYHEKISCFSITSEVLAARKFSH